MFRFALAALAFAAAVVPLHAQRLPSEAELRRHIEILASDRFQGREPGTIGEAIAAHYIAAQFGQMGLEPLFENSFYQPVPLVERRADSSDVAILGSVAENWSEEHVVAIGPADRRVIDGPILFAGFGEDIDALRNLPIEGALVLLLPGAPRDAREFPSYAERRRMIGELGAGAVFGISDDGLTWEATVRRYREGRGELANATNSAIEGAVIDEAVLRLLEAEGFEISDLERFADRPDFEPVALASRARGSVQTRIWRYNGYNVAGRLRGSGDSGETVVVMAHYDHFGICRPEGSPDRICNGAIDNASGTAAMIEVARALAADEAPTRDVLFLATTAEEMGLLGASHFTDNSPLPLGSLVAALNLDTIALLPAGAPVAIVGYGLTGMDPVVERIAAQQGRTIYEGDGPDLFVRRQDGWALLRRGVPAILVGGALTDPEVLRNFTRGRYHDASDNLDEEFEIGGALEDTWLHILLVEALADPGEYPTPPR